jgi:hypothetical protein
MSKSQFYVTVWTFQELVQMWETRETSGGWERSCRHAVGDKSKDNRGNARERREGLGLKSAQRG